MAKQLIPMRPTGFISKLAQEEQDALTWFVLSGCNRKDAFCTFARPDMAKSRAKAAVEEYVKQFFSSKDATDYIEAYQKTIDDLLHPATTKAQPSGSMEERKARAKTKLVEFAMDLADNIENADDPEFVLKMADKAGLLDQEEEVDELPRRYLPESCGACAYRAFCEKECDDLCEICRAKKFAVENGFEFKKEDLLDFTGTEIAV